MTVETQVIREGLFRFGQWFSRQNRKFSYYRDPIANLLCKGTVEDALLKGFDVVAPNTDTILPWNSELQKVQPDHYPEALQTIFFKNRDGRALHAFFTRDSTYVNFAGADGQYRVYRNALGKLTKGTFTVPIHNFPGAKIQQLDKEENDNFTELITQRREKVAEGMSLLEPIWDTLFALYMLVSHSAYFMARAGAGIKDIAVDEAALVDTKSAAILTTLHDAMADFGSASDTVVRPKTLAGQPVDFEIHTVDTAVDFQMILTVYLTIISAHTGIPRSALEGLVPGQLAGAIVNESSYFDFLSDLQQKHVGYLKWYVRQLATFYNFGAKKETEVDEGIGAQVGEETSLLKEELQFDIQFRVREVISEKEKTELAKIKVDLAGSLNKLGLKTFAAIKYAGLKGISEEMLKDNVDEPIVFGAAPPGNNESDEDADKDTDDQNDEEPDDKEDK